MEALRFARQSEEPLARATSNRLLGQVYQHRDQLDLARTAYEKALEAAREGRLLSDEFEARMAIARLDRLEDTPGPRAPSRPSPRRPCPRASTSSP